MFDEFQQIIDSLGKYGPPKGQYSDISQANQGEFQAPIAAGAGSALAETTDRQVSNADAAARSRLAEIQGRVKEMEEENDPSKYYLQLRDDGGFNYYNPRGEQISLAQYSLATNKTADEILGKSGANRDVEFVDRQNILNDIAEARYYGDKEKEQELIDKYGGEDEEIKKTIKSLTVQEMVERLAEEYSDVLGDSFQQQGGIGVGATSDTLQETRSFGQQIKDLFNPRQ